MSGARRAPVLLFHEGQRVRVRPDLNAPGWTVLLREDAEAQGRDRLFPPEPSSPFSMGTCRDATGFTSFVVTSAARVG